MMTPADLLAHVPTHLPTRFPGQLPPHSFLVHHFFLIRASQLLTRYGYIVLLPVAVFEGPVAAILAGALVASGEFNGVTVFLILLIADLIGDFMYYALGRWGNIHSVERLRKRLGITDDRIDSFKKHFRKNDWKFLIAGKTQALGSVILYFAGVTEMDLKRFFYWNFISTIPKILLFLFIGYLFGQSIINSQRYLNYIGIGSFAVAVLLIIGYLFVKRYLAKVAEEI